VGQFIASSPTLFPAPYVLEFQKCLDRTDPVPWAQARVIIESDLGRPLTDVYSYVNTNVLASASIAQVRISSMLVLAALTFRSTLRGLLVVTANSSGSYRSVIGLCMQTHHAAEAVSIAVQSNFANTALRASQLHALCADI
jgi:ABC1 atypical kinase-like domain